MAQANKSIASTPVAGEIDFSSKLNDALRIFFRDIVKTALADPSQALFLLRTLRWQQRAAKTRSHWGKQGLHVPPIMIFSITNRCNLHCKGCFNSALRQSVGNELGEDKLRKVIAEAEELGVSFMVIGGGEPLMRPEILDIIGDFPQMIFLMFTNGLLIDEKLIGRLRKLRNLIPLISLEGQQAETDERRGMGVFEHVSKTFGAMKHRGVFWGTSITMTRSNFPLITDGEFVRGLVEQGCKLFLYVEYTPIREGTESWVLSEGQRKEIQRLKDDFSSRFRAVFVMLPSDEEEVGGCLAAGRGFVHVNAEGNVEPCPFIPYSDVNLRDASIREALGSDFLRKIRENHSHLDETSGGCALWAQREWVSSIAKTQKDAPT